jgi:hypothetical protein
MKKAVKAKLRQDPEPRHPRLDRHGADATAHGQPGHSLLAQRRSGAQPVAETIGWRAYGNSAGTSRACFPAGCAC